MESLVGSAIPQTTRQVKCVTPVKRHRYSNTATKVEGEAQGDDDVIQTFLKDVDKGPAGSKVVKLDTEDRDVAEGEIGFELRY